MVAVIIGGIIVVLFVVGCCVKTTQTVVVSNPTGVDRRRHSDYTGYLDVYTSVGWVHTKDETLVDSLQSGDEIVVQRRLLGSFLTIVGRKQHPSPSSSHNPITA